MEKFDSKLDMSKKVSIETIAETLVRAADRITRYHISIALGQEPPEGFEKGNREYQQKILDQIEPFLKNYQETKQITANSSGSVITLLSKGKIKPNEAISLLKVIKTKMEVEEDEMALSLKKKLLKEIDREERKKNNEK